MDWEGSPPFSPSGPQGRASIMFQVGGGMPAHKTWLARFLSEETTATREAESLIMDRAESIALHKSHLESMPRAMHSLRP